MRTKIILFMVAVFVVQVGMAQVNPASASSQNAASVANNSGVYLESYGDSFNDHANFYANNGVCATFEHDFTIGWADGGGGASVEHYVDVNYRGYNDDEYYTNTWPATWWPEVLPDGLTCDDYVVYHDAYMGLQSCATKFQRSYLDDDGELWADETFGEGGQACLTLATGGSPGSTKVNLWVVSASATARAFISSSEFPDDPPGGMAVGAIPFRKISAGVFGQLDDQGHAFMLLPDNAFVDMTPYVAGNDYYTFNDPPGPVTLISLTVVSNAAAVGGTNNWAAVKTNDWVYVQAKLSTDDPKAADQIQWSGGEAVPGNPWQHRVTKTVSAETTVTATLGSTNKSVNVWIIWSDLTISTSGSIDNGNDADDLINHSWPIYLGGGNSLGPIDCLGNTNLTFAFTIGKMQAKTVLQPAGIENIVTNGWHLHRRAQFIAWDNGLLSASDTGDFTYDDTSASEWMDQNPKSGTSIREIYDLDAPGCPIHGGTSINHTAEVYDNFKEFATVTLGSSEQPCSNTNTWSCTAQIDVDKSTNKVELNSVTTSLLTLPTNPHYSQR